MSIICDYCGKRRMKGNRVSHAKNRTIRFFKPNLHPHKVMENGKTVSRQLCSGCWKKAQNQSAGKEQSKNGRQKMRS